MKTTSYTAIKHCSLCGFENLATSFRKGRCRAQKTCIARAEANRPDWLKAFRTLSAEAAGEVARKYDAAKAASIAATEAGDYSVKFPNLEEYVWEAVKAQGNA